MSVRKAEIQTRAERIPTASITCNEVLAATDYVLLIIWELRRNHPMYVAAGIAVAHGVEW
jgi:hypothetical protein